MARAWHPADDYSKKEESKRVVKNSLALQRLLIFIAPIAERHPEF
jgi:hypothetical protein